MVTEQGGGFTADGACPQEIRLVLKSLVSGAQTRTRCIGRSLDPNLMSFLLALYNAQGGRCALSGLCSDLQVVGSGKTRRPFAPSFDSIDPAGGYIRDNIQLVCQAVNFALNAYGEDTFREIVKTTAPSSRRRSHQPTKPSGNARALTSITSSTRRRRSSPFTVVNCPSPACANFSASHSGVRRLLTRPTPTAGVFVASPKSA